jgi:hypothetical protein
MSESEPALSPEALSPEALSLEAKFVLAPDDSVLVSEQVRRIVVELLAQLHEKESRRYLVLDDDALAEHKQRVLDSALLALSKLRAGLEVELRRKLGYYWVLFILALVLGGPDVSVGFAALAAVLTFEKSWRRQYGVELDLIAQAETHIVRLRSSLV